LLEWVAWDSFEFDKASCVSGYSFPDPCAFYTRSYYTPPCCGMCNSSDHNITSCPYYAYYAQPDFAPPKDITNVVLTLSDSFLPVAQYMEFEGVNLLGMLLVLVGLVHVWSPKIHLI